MIGQLTSFKFSVMIQGFKEFIMRGNVIDLAVGVIIGGAFGKIVDAFMGGFVNPLIALLLGSPDPAKAFESIAIGSFPIGLILAAVINFVLVAAVVYLFLVVPMNKMKKAEPPAPPAGPSEVDLLKEIRDALKK